jgi:hypothetical protein
MKKDKASETEDEKRLSTIAAARILESATGNTRGSIARMKQQRKSLKAT